MKKKGNRQRPPQPKTPRAAKRRHIVVRRTKRAASIGGVAIDPRPFPSSRP